MTEIFLGICSHIWTSSYVFVRKTLVEIDIIRVLKIAQLFRIPRAPAQMRPSVNPCKASVNPCKASVLFQQAS